MVDPRTTELKRRGAIYIPQAIFTPVFVVEIADVDQTAKVLSVSTERVSLRQNRVGSFTCILDNVNGQFTNSYTGGEKFEVFADYTGGTNRIFKGKVEDVLYSCTFANGFTITLEGKEVPELSDRKITVSFTNKIVSDCIKEIIDSYFSGILEYVSLGNIPTSVTATYIYKPAIQIISDLLLRGGYDGYLKYNNSNNKHDINAFTSQTNNSESISYGINFDGLSDWGSRNSERANRVHVYGSTAEDSTNVIFLQTKEDTVNQGVLWIKDEIVTESDISTMGELQTKLDAEYNVLTTAPAKGVLRATGGLPTVFPGQSIKCSVPLCKINDYFVSKVIRDDISTNGWITSVEFASELKDIPKIFTSLFTIQSEQQEIKNENDMLDSYVVRFDENPSICTHTNTQETNSTLKLASGQTDGTVIITLPDLGYTAASVQIEVHGEDLGDSTVEFNGDGFNYRTIITGIKNSITNTGVKRLVRISLSSDSANTEPKIWTLGVMTK